MPMPKPIYGQLLVPALLLAALSGGINDQTRLPRWFERQLFGRATVKDLIESTPRVIVNATDVYNRVPFAFTAQTFNAICSDPASVLVADAVAASAAVPIAFVPIVMQVYKFPGVARGAVCPCGDTGVAFIMPYADTEAMHTHPNKIGRAIAPHRAGADPF